MIKTQLVLWKTTYDNRMFCLRVNVRVRFLLFYLKYARTDPWCNMLQTLVGRKKYQEKKSDEHPLSPVGLVTNVNFNLLSFQRCRYDNDFWPIRLEDLNIILGAWNGFLANCRENCDRIFLLNQDFLKHCLLLHDWSACTC